MYHRGTGDDRVQLAIYVDNIRVVGKQLRKVEEAKAELSRRYNMIDEGELTYILGMEVHGDRGNRTLLLHQTKYAT